MKETIIEFGWMMRTLYCAAVSFVCLGFHKLDMRKVYKILRIHLCKQTVECAIHYEDYQTVHRFIGYKCDLENGVYE